MKTDILLVQSNVPTKEIADRIADAAMEQRLAAAVQIIGPVESRYRWQGQIHKGEEWICQFKTSEAAYPELEALIMSLHPYEVPGVLAMPAVAGYEPYLAWVRTETQILDADPLLQNSCV